MFARQFFHKSKARQLATVHDETLKGGKSVRTSSASSTIDALGPGPGTTLVVSFTGEAADAVAEHSFLNAGEAISAPSSDLFLGVSFLRAGEGVACRETVVFLSGLTALPSSLADDDDGDLVTLMSSEPRARLLVGVTALILGAKSVMLRLGLDEPVGSVVDRGASRYSIASE